MFDSMWPHRRQPARLPCPWDSPGKNPGVGCYFLLQYMKVKSKSEVAQLCPTLSDPMDCSAPGSSIHEIFQTGVLEWGAIASITPIQNKKLKRKSPITDGIGDIGAELATPNVSVACRLFCTRKKKKSRLRKKDWERNFDLPPNCLKESRQEVCSLE